MRHRGDPLDPRRLQRAELRPDRDLTVWGDLDPRTRPPRGHRHRLDQRVHPEGQPWIRQDRLQAPGDPGFSRAGAAIENDHLSCHRATVHRHTCQPDDDFTGVRSALRMPVNLPGDSTSRPG